MKQINFIDFNDYFDPENVIDTVEGYKKGEFSDKGIYSERIFLKIHHLEQKQNHI